MPPPKKPVDPADARYRKARAQLMEMQLAVKKGLLVPREEKDQAMTNVGLETRKTVLAFARRLPPLVHGLQDVRAAADIIMREAEAVLTALSRERTPPPKGRRGPGRPRKESA